MLLPSLIAEFLFEQHAATKTAIPSVKERRRIAAPRFRACADYAVERRNYSRDLRSAIEVPIQVARQQF
jgi:siderophore synthetase component